MNCPYNGNQGSCEFSKIFFQRLKCYSVSTNGITLTEVMVASVLGALLFGVVSMVLSRTNLTFMKTTDMVNAQVLLESILERFRSDARSMSRLEMISEDAVKFRTTKGGKSLDVTWRFSPENRELSREEFGMTGKSERFQDFQSKGKIRRAQFQPGKMEIPGTFEIHDHIDLILDIVFQEKPEAPPTKLSIVSQMFSKCVQLPNPYRRIE